MCGRYAHNRSIRRIKDDLHISRSGDDEVDEVPCFNQPPGCFTHIAMMGGHGNNTAEVAPAYWGFIPSWAEKLADVRINARVETAARKPYWRKAFHKRRAVIPADWWYEWQRTDAGKQPYAIKPTDTDRFYFAGVWSIARSLPSDSDVSQHPTYAILTREAHPDISFIHHRMPIALTAAGARAWLAAEENTDLLIAHLVAGTCAHYLTAAVSTVINNPGRSGDRARDHSRRHITTRPSRARHRQRLLIGVCSVNPAAILATPRDNLVQPIRDEILERLDTIFRHYDPVRAVLLLRRVLEVIGMLVAAT